MITKIPLSRDAFFYKWLEKEKTQLPQHMTVSQARELFDQKLKDELTHEKATQKSI
jgi:hypothetical protein